MGGMIAAGILPSLAIKLGWQFTIHLFGLVLLCFIFMMYKRQRKLNEEQPIKSIQSGSYKEVFKNKNAVRLSIVGNILAAAQFILISYIVIYLQLIRDFSFVEASFFLSLFQFSGIAARIALGWVSDHLYKNKKNLLMFSLILSGILLSSFVPVSLYGSYSLIIGWIILLGLTVNGWPGIFMSLMVDLVPNNLVGRLSGYTMLLIYSGILFGPISFSIIISASNFSLAFYLLAFAVVIALLIMLPIKIYQREEQNLSSSIQPLNKHNA